KGSAIRLLELDVRGERRGEIRESSTASEENGREISNVMAVAHGNRTHRGRLSAPATGFEDRASHQIRTRYRLVLTLKLGQMHNVRGLWCRGGAIELQKPSVCELIRAALLGREVRVALGHQDRRVA